MGRLGGLSLACCLLLAVAAWGQTEKKVNLKNGRTFQGVVNETDAGYRIESAAGVVVNVPKDAVASIEDVVTPQEEYAKRLAAIDAKDPEAHLQLGQWALAENLLDIARSELEEAIRLKPDFELARLTLRQVEIKLAAQKSPGAAAAETPGADAGADAPLKIDQAWLLNDEEIARINVAELREDDNSVVVLFMNDLPERFIELHQGKGEFEQKGFANEFRAYAPARKARYILDHLDPSEEALKRDIIIKSDRPPQFMQEFRTKVVPILASHCGASACHGGEKAEGNLRLLNLRGRDRRADYTNFLILDSYSSGGHKMIDRDRPEDSLLLQHGLPPTLAKFPHLVKITPPFPTPKSINYRRVYEWIDTLKGPPHPDYGTTLRIPWAPPVGRGGEATVPTAAELPEGEDGESPSPQTQPAEEGQSGR